ncbi:MAG: energy transducer TonB, partial [Spirochaetota bacterium]
ESGTWFCQVTAANAASAMSTVVSGSEKGNSLETVLGARAGKAGRSLYVPIYLYMPLPRSIDASVAGKVPAERRENFFRFYSRSGDTWALSRDVPVAERDDLWMSLEEGGYDFSKADYLDGGRLKPLTLSFVVTQAVGRSQPRLEAVTVTSSSGDPQVDEAVVYGFRRASFFNATDGTISGTFTYRFSK